ncbi:MAG: S41 family peptidase [Solirubrobacterales bacterium]
MRVGLGILATLIGTCVLSASVPAAQTASESQGVLYQGLEPGVFMKEWLACGPFSVFDGPKQPEDSAALRQGFDRDFLTDHGGESQIQPTPGMTHTRNGEEYRWRKIKSPTDLINLIRHLSYEKYATGYAWARIDMPAETPAILGIGSDDAVKVWLNGKLVHENWTSRPVKADDDLVRVTFQAGSNTLLLKVQNNTELWGFACRRLDPNTLGDKLLSAVQSGDANAVEMCLSQGVKLNATDKYGFTAVQVAKMRGQEKIVRLLVGKGADPNVAMPAAGTPVGFLDLLWSSLKENYPMMEYAGAFDESWYDACKERIKDMSSLYEALPIMDAMLVQRLNDYHTGMYWEGKQGLDRPPIRVAWIENQVVVTLASKESGISIGDIVVEIDGAGAKEKFESRWPDAFGATPYARARSACDTILEGKTGSQVKLELTNRQGETYEKTLTRGERGDFGLSPDPVLHSRSINDRVGYIRIRGWGGFQSAEFDKLLESFREKPCLILDVRDNGGGSDELAETVIGRFITRKVVASISFQRRAGTDTYEKFINVVSPRGPWCYAGKVAVLTNEGCASACEHFASGMYEAGATLVGTPTTGACGWSKGIDLPAGVTLHCSLTFPLHGKMPSPLHGIEPHHLVTPTIEDLRAGRDTVLEKAIALLTP